MVMAPPARERGAGWVLARPLRQPHRGQPRPPHKPARRDPSSLIHDHPPPVGVQLVRPRRYAPAGAPTGPLPRGGVTRQLRGRSRRKSHSQPGDTTQVTGLKPHALLTPVALMGAALGVSLVAVSRPNGRASPATPSRVRAASRTRASAPALGWLTEEDCNRLHRGTCPWLPAQQT
jgi:hypothetical protein